MSQPSLAIFPLVSLAPFLASVSRDHFPDKLFSIESLSPCPLLRETRGRHVSYVRSITPVAKVIGQYLLEEWRMGWGSYVGKGPVALLTVDSSVLTGCGDELRRTRLA